MFPERPRSARRIKRSRLISRAREWPGSRSEKQVSGSEKQKAVKNSPKHNQALLLQRVFAKIMSVLFKCLNLSRDTANREL